MDYQAKMVLMAKSRASEVNNFSPTAFPNPPSFIPYSAFQRLPASTLSSSPQITLHLILDRLLVCLYTLPQQKFLALFRTKFIEVDHRFVFEFQ